MGISILISQFKINLSQKKITPCHKKSDFLLSLDFAWKTIVGTECSHSCGLSGILETDIVCVAIDVISGNSAKKVNELHHRVNDRNCEHLKKPLPEYVRCNTEIDCSTGKVQCHHNVSMNYMFNILFQANHVHCYDLCMSFFLNFLKM